MCSDRMVGAREDPAVARLLSTEDISDDWVDALADRSMPGAGPEAGEKPSLRGGGGGGGGGTTEKYASSSPWSDSSALAPCGGAGW